MSKIVLLETLEQIRKGLVELLVYGGQMDEFARHAIVNRLIDQLGSVILAVREAV